MPIPINIVAAKDFNPERRTNTLDADTLIATQSIVDDVHEQRDLAVRKYAAKFAERADSQPLWIDRKAMQNAVESLSEADVALLKRVHRRIETFANAQLKCLSPLSLPVMGGLAGHTIEPIERVGCYAPAGRFPLPSTVLMTVTTARVAGCREVLLATPNPNPLMLAAAAIAGADRVLAVGGAHAIAALTYGLEGQQGCDLIVGPGNRWVTAAKKLVSGNVGIDMLAGPSELVVVADSNANPKTVAADMIAQAEHDIDARAILICDAQPFAEQVAAALEEQLVGFPNAETARAALGASAIVVASSIDNGQDRNSGIGLANRLAPEHLELHCTQASEIAKQIRHAGCVFIGGRSAEVFGDYGVGPNHTLPTGGTARWSAGLNVFTFLRTRTWVNLENAPADLVDDTCRLATLEGLTGHARASERRQPAV